MFIKTLQKLYTKNLDGNKEITYIQTRPKEDKMTRQLRRRFQPRRLAFRGVILLSQNYQLVTRLLAGTLA